MSSQIDELIAMSSPPREQNKNYWLAADINALNGLTGALSEAVCEPGVLQGKTDKFYSKNMRNSCGLLGRKMMMNQGIAALMMKPMLFQFARVLELTLPW